MSQQQQQTLESPVKEILPEPLFRPALDDAENHHGLDHVVPVGSTNPKYVAKAGKPPTHEGD
jgi:hypothetical protein